MVAPVPIGVLFDMDLGPLEGPVRDGFTAGLDAVPLDRDVDVTWVHADGLPDGTAVIEAVRRPDVDALVYLGLGLAAQPLAVAKRSAGWGVPAVANTALMHGHAHPDWTEAWDGWVYVDMTADTNPALVELTA